VLIEFFLKLRQGGVPASVKEFLMLIESLGGWERLMAEDIRPEALHSQDRHKIVPPLHGALIKNEQDVHLFERLVFMSRRQN
jgi:uncharacterized protein with von Willebrand factor type A (vWA) domain